MAACRSKVSSVFRPNLFKDKVAIVTGGGTGIGKAIALELLYLGCKVMIASRKMDRLQKAAKEMKTLIDSQGRGSASLKHVECNIRKEEQVQHLISHTISEFGQLDFLVNNGGGQFPSPAEGISLKGWNAVIETNLTGTFLCCREAYTQWMKDHGGVIVNIIADMWRGFPLMSHTGAARSAVDNLTKSLAIEWAEDGVRVNAVAPGSSIYSETAADNYGDTDIFKRVLPNIPAKRLGLTEEVSGAVCFLLSPAASYISGETVKVDAGGSLYPSWTWNIDDHKKSVPYSWETDDNGSHTPPKSKL
ncbi:peroxisomal trans-2-enoyl-CoA reductase-like [Gigantopelta aegis]|uniref:peroxisomal trans-2-enoyl-CoA reductase-like n=1 Tax=Gigantopelta aegis TaxID=1735272 RepID=UPI001B8873D1|nr:peroxisomal trans-2-enoyl-CoA reductase-like [Gigantopelta aegis]